MKWQKETHIRRMKWIFSKSGVMTLAFEHFLAMIPATILVPILVNNTIGMNIIDMSLVLFTSGLGTIMFSLFSVYTDKDNDKNIVMDNEGKPVKKRIPAYLGSSFAYIGLTLYLLDLQIGEGASPQMAYVYVGWSYIFSGLILIVLSFLYKIKWVSELLSKGLPPAVIGPAISLIGLELADSALVDSGIDIANGISDANSIIVAIITLSFIIFFSLIKTKVFKNTAIIIGMVVGWLAYWIINGMPVVDFNATSIFSCPNFRLPIMTFPPNIVRLFISVIPATFVVFTENIGRVMVINRMVTERDEDTELFDESTMAIMGKALLGHGVASFTATMLGSVPNTLYAENIAVMGIHKNADVRPESDKFIRNITNPYSVIPFIIAALFAIVFSFITVLQNIIISIPKPVIGGMELFLFGIISAPGIQLLVEQRVNYKKVSNQIITAAVLITGISELSFNFRYFELKGMSLGLVVGILLNIIVIILKKVGWLCDPLCMDEVLADCIKAIPDSDCEKINVSGCLMNKDESVTASTMKKILNNYKGNIKVGENNVSAEQIRDGLPHVNEVEISSSFAVVKIIKGANRISVDISTKSLDCEMVNICLNDYQDAIDIVTLKVGDGNEKEDFMNIDLSHKISLHKVTSIIQSIKW